MTSPDTEGLEAVLVASGVDAEVAKELVESFEWEKGLLRDICALDPKNDRQFADIRDRIETALSGREDLVGKRFLQAIGDIKLNIHGSQISTNHKKNETYFKESHVKGSPLQAPGKDKAPKDKETGEPSVKAKHIGTADPVAIQAFVKTLGTNVSNADGIYLQFKYPEGHPQAGKKLAVKDYSAKQVQQLAMAFHAARQDGYEIRNVSEINELKTKFPDVFADAKSAYASYLENGHTAANKKDVGRVKGVLSKIFDAVVKAILGARDNLQKYNKQALIDNADKFAEPDEPTVAEPEEEPTEPGAEGGEPSADSGEPEDTMEEAPPHFDRDDIIERYEDLKGYATLNIVETLAEAGIINEEIAKNVLQQMQKNAESGSKKTIETVLKEAGADADVVGALVSHKEASARALKIMRKLCSEGESTSYDEIEHVLRLGKTSVDLLKQAGHDELADALLEDLKTDKDILNHLWDKTDIKIDFDNPSDDGEDPAPHA